MLWSNEMKLSRRAKNQKRAMPKSEAERKLAVGCSAWLGLISHDGFTSGAFPAKPVAVDALLNHVAIELPLVPPASNRIDDGGDDPDAEKRNRANQSHAENRAIILYKLDETKPLESLLGTEKQKGSGRTKRYEIAWSELEELKNSLGYLVEHGERPNEK